MTIRGSSRAGDVAIHAAGASSPLPAQADSSHADFPLETCLEGRVLRGAGRAATAPLTSRRTLLAGGAAAGGLLAWSPPSLAAL